MTADQAAAERVELTFARFYRDEVATTLAVVLALRGPRVATEEIVQEAFLRAYDRWEDVRRMARPDLWVQRVALNLATSQLRRLAAEGRALVRLRGRDRGDGADSSAYEQAEAFWRLVRKLPPQQARIVALHYAGDLSVRDIAEVLEIAEGTVKAHLHAARRRLAAQIGEEAHDG